MSERLATGEIRTIDPEIMSTIITNFETSIMNARLLQAVLAEEDVQKRNVSIESISSSLDIGGFFVDEKKTDPAYRNYMRRGPKGGDSISGTVEGLIARIINGKSELQIVMNLGPADNPLACYFKFNDSLEGCTFSRL